MNQSHFNGTTTLDGTAFRVPYHAQVTRRADDVYEVEVVIFSARCGAIIDSFARTVDPGVARSPKQAARLVIRNRDRF